MQKSGRILSVYLKKEIVKSQRRKSRKVKLKLTLEEFTKRQEEESARQRKGDEEMKDEHQPNVIGN